VYVLGVGPAVWMVNRYPATGGFLQTMYVPLVIIAHNCQPLGEALNWYMRPWA